MTIFLVRTYVVKPDKLSEHDAWGKKLVALMKNRPDLFKEVKSLKVLSQKYGDNIGGYVAMWKFESLADSEKWENNFKKNKEQMTLKSEFMALIVPGTYSAKIWEPVKTLLRPHKPSQRSC
jgi:antibiotic biosynthesis monooxygenase (ABM) superfamily enzyme